MSSHPAPSAVSLNRASAAQAITVATVTVLPGYLLAALAVQVSADLRFGAATLGILVAVFFLAAAVSSPSMGRAVGRWGAGHGAAMASTLCAVAMAAVALTQDVTQLYVALALAGVANGLSQPASNTLIFGAIRPGRLGVAFGIKQASVPAAALLSGAALPTVGLLVGWRWTFVIAALLTGVFAAWQWTTMGRRADPRSTERTRLRDGSSSVSALLALSAAGLLGAAAAGSFGTFFILAWIERGLTPGTAGWVYAVLASGTLIARIGSGWFVDRSPRLDRGRLMSTMLVLGAVGFLAMAVGDLVVALVGAAFACVIGWGWTGVFQYVTVVWYPENPAIATGVTQAGVATGAALGPLVLGLAAEQRGYEFAWFVAGACSLVAALCVVVAKRRQAAGEPVSA